MDNIRCHCPSKLLFVHLFVFSLIKMPIWHIYLSNIIQWSTCCLRLDFAFVCADTSFRSMNVFYGKTIVFQEHAFDLCNCRWIENRWICSTKMCSFNISFWAKSNSNYRWYFVFVKSKTNNVRRIQFNFPFSSQ